MPSGHAGLASWTVDPSPTCSTVTIAGELDISVIGALRAGIDDVLSTDGVVILDVAGITFIDSTGLRLLLDVKRTVTDSGGALFLRDASAPVERVLEVTGMTSFFEHRMPMPARGITDQAAAG